MNNKIFWKYFRKYNRKYFKNKIPIKDVFVVVTDRGMKTSLASTTEETYQRKNGTQYCIYKITISRKAWKCGLRVVLFLLLHEMCHIAIGLEHDHDKVFQTAQKKLLFVGAYDSLI